jgi:hypothetical protein
MRLSRTIIAGIAVAAAAAAVATPAFAGQSAHSDSHARALPTHVFAPYFE